MPKRRLPLRSCVICGHKSGKAELTRIAATPEGGLLLDPTGKMPGRGAYVCRDQAQHRKGLERKRVDHTLRIQTTETDWAQLISGLEAINLNDSESPRGTTPVPAVKTGRLTND